MTKDIYTLKIKDLFIAFGLSVFSISVFFLFPFAEFSLDSFHILKEVMRGHHYDTSPGFSSTRYYLSDAIVYWWDLFLRGENLPSYPITFEELKISAQNIVLLSKICGAVSVGILFIYLRCLNVNLNAAITVSFIFAITSNHWMMSGIVERQIIAQFILLAMMSVSFGPIKNSIYRNFAIAWTSMAAIFLALIYSPLIIVSYTPALILLQRCKWELNASGWQIVKYIVQMILWFVFCNVIFDFLINAHYFSIFLGAGASFTHYGSPLTNDQFSVLSKELMIANFYGIFSQYTVWIPSIVFQDNPDNFISFSKTSIFGIFSGIIAVIFYYLALHKVPKAAHTLLKHKSIDNDTSLQLLLGGLFIVAISFTFAVRHGNQAEFHVIPGTFLFMTLALNINRNVWRTRLSLIIAVLIFCLNLSINPYNGLKFEERNQYQYSNSSSIESFINEFIIQHPLNK